MDELHTLRSSIPEHDCQLLDDMNIHLDKPVSSKLIEQTRSLRRICKADSFLLRSFSVCLPEHLLLPPLAASLCCSLYKLSSVTCPYLSSTHFASTVDAALPPPTMFSSLEVIAAKELLSSTLSSWTVCPLSSNPLHSYSLTRG